MTRRQAIAPSPKRESRAGALLRGAADMTGVSAVARVVIEASDDIVDRTVALAREHGVSETKIRAALRLRSKAERLQSLVALVLPGLPNPRLLRYVARKPEARTR